MSFKETLEHEIRDLKRFDEIMLILFEEGFYFLINKIKLKKHIPFKKRWATKNHVASPPERLRITFERLGPTFAKLGQLLSVRPDLIPMEYVKELGKLQDGIPGFSFEEVKKVIKSEFGKDVYRVFRRFDKEPIASASISQVHKAVLRSGEVVAVKVQRPNIRKIMLSDMDIMMYIAKQIDKHVPKLKKYDPINIVKEFARWTNDELDFRKEAKNAEKFYENFKDSESVKIPKVYKQYTTSKVLTTEFLNGIEIHNIGDLKKKGLDLDLIIKNGFDAIFTQVFVHGFFHADPHPGNILILKNNVIAFVDFGIVGYFDPVLKQRTIDIVYGITKKDPDLIVDAFTEMGLRGNTEDVERFKRKLLYLIEPLQTSSLKNARLGYMLDQVWDEAFKHNVKPPVNFVLFGKTLATLEGIGLLYDPDFEVVKYAKPYLKKLMKPKFDLTNNIENLVRTSSKYRNLIKTFPDRASRVFDLLEKGEIKIEIEDTDIKRLSLELDKSSNRISYGVIVASLVLAAALIMQVEKGELIFGLPAFSFIAFLIALVIGIFLFSSILNEGRFKA